MFSGGYRIYPKTQSPAYHVQGVSAYADQKFPAKTTKCTENMLIRITAMGSLIRYIAVSLI